MINFWMDKDRLDVDFPLYNRTTNELIYILAPPDHGWIIMKVADVKIGIDVLSKGFSYV